MKFAKIAIVLIAGIAAIVHSYSATKHVLERRRAAMAPPTLATWIHAFGCSERDTIIYLVFSNGKVVAISQGILNAEQKQQIVKFIGDTDGYNAQAVCGKQT